MWLNKVQNDALRPREAVYVPRVVVLGATMKSQSMWVYPGQVLLACCANSKGLRNGVRQTVVEATKDHVTLQNGSKLSLQEAGKLLRLAHAQTYASCQGDEFDSVRLWDTEHPKFTWRHLYVGLSRGRCAEMV